MKTKNKINIHTHKTYKKAQKQTNYSDNMTIFYQVITDVATLQKCKTTIDKYSVEARQLKF